MVAATGAVTGATKVEAKATINLKEAWLLRIKKQEKECPEKVVKPLTVVAAAVKERIEGKDANSVLS